MNTSEKHENSLLIPTLEGVGKLLDEFEKLEKIKSRPEYEQIAKIKDNLSKIKTIQDELSEQKGEESTEQKTLKDKLSKELANQLTALLKVPYFSEIKIDNISFADVLYDGALVLASLSPINSTDPFTLDEIDLKNRVLTSDQHQFDVSSLFEFIKKSPLESLANPFTREKFSERDKRTILKHVKNYAERENKTVRILYVKNPDVHGDPDYQATIALAQQLSSPGQPQQAQFGFFNQPSQSTPRRPWQSDEPTATLPNGDIAVGGRSYDSLIRVYNPVTYQLVERFSQSGDGVSVMVLLPDGNLAVGGPQYNSQIRIYNPTTGNLVRSFSQDNNSARSMVVLPDGNLAVGGSSYAEHIRIYNPTTGSLVRSFSQDNNSARAMVVLPDGNLAVGGSSYDEHIRIYNPTTGSLVRSFSQNNKGVSAMIVLPDGNLAVGGPSYNSLIRIYNPTTGMLVQSYSQEGRGIENETELRERYNQLTGTQTPNP